MKKVILIGLSALVVGVALLAISWTPTDSTSTAEAVRVVTIDCSVTNPDTDEAGPDFGVVTCEIKIKGFGTHILKIGYNDTSPPHPRPNFGDEILGCRFDGKDIHVGPCP